MIDQIFKAITVSGASSYLGPEWLDVEDAPPALIWVPTEGSFSTGQRKANTGDILTRSIGTAELTVRVRVWTVWPASTPKPSGYDQSQADYQATWELLRKFLVAVYDASMGSFRVDRMTWLTEAGQALVEHGKAVDVDIVFEVPVTRSALTGVQISNAQAIGALGP
jgi:hypothetical protein